VANKDPRTETRTVTITRTYTFTHGYSAYSSGRCRCDECRAAWADYRREKERERWRQMVEESGLSEREIKRLGFRRVRAMIEAGELPA
jgi:hypothetical protein